eukprot:TRINITY_DN2045_c0_g1_i7.p1 TRINITY_DN2045_c0_g1~~TRINITY_DN2045_c0_g1_i7.p1  ORF type:complete len:923 (-),score=162.71 TRINITY_DN2045_c0_g1_i7:307-2709(-)
MDAYFEKKKKLRKFIEEVKEGHYIYSPINEINFSVIEKEELRNSLWKDTSSLDCLDYAIYFFKYLLKNSGIVEKDFQKGEFQKATLYTERIFTVGKKIYGIKESVKKLFELLNDRIQYQKPLLSPSEMSNHRIDIGSATNSSGNGKTLMCYYLSEILYLFPKLMNKENLENVDESLVSFLQTFLKENYDEYKSVFQKLKSGQFFCVSVQYNSAYKYHNLKDYTVEQDFSFRLFVDRLCPTDEEEVWKPLYERFVPLMPLQSRQMVELLVYHHQKFVLLNQNRENENNEKMMIFLTIDEFDKLNLNEESIQTASSINSNVEYFEGLRKKDSKNSKRVTLVHFWTTLDPTLITSPNDLKNGSNRVIRFFSYDNIVPYLHHFVAKNENDPMSTFYSQVALYRTQGNMKLVKQILDHFRRKSISPVNVLTLVSLDFAFPPHLGNKDFWKIVAASFCNLKVNAMKPIFGNFLDYFISKTIIPREKTITIKDLFSTSTTFCISKLFLYRYSHLFSECLDEGVRLLSKDIKNFLELELFYSPKSLELYYCYYLIITLNSYISLSLLNYENSPQDGPDIFNSFFPQFLVDNPSFTSFLATKSLPFLQIFPNIRSVNRFHYENQTFFEPTKLSLNLKDIKVISFDYFQPSSGFNFQLGKFYLPLSSKNPGYDFLFCILINNTKSYLFFQAKEKEANSENNDLRISNVKSCSTKTYAQLKVLGLEKEAKHCYLFVVTRKTCLNWDDIKMEGEEFGGVYLLDESSLELSFGPALREISSYPIESILRKYKRKRILPSKCEFFHSKLFENKI